MILCDDLTGVMQINTRGTYADRCYYDYSETHTNKVPYLSVNRRANMPSLLSEAGFHTNPEQQCNLNADYKRMEALSAFRSILEFMKVEKPLMGAVCGVIKDKETGIAVNGAKVTIDGKEYTTDTYESLFKNYSKDLDQLHNGYFFIERFTGGAKLNIQYSSPVHNSVNNQITDEAFNAFSPLTISFSIKEQTLTSDRMFDPFNTLTNWWQPQQSGSSSALVPEQTSAKISTDIHLNETDNTGSCNLSNGWDLNAPGVPYIRFHIQGSASQNNTKINPDDIIEMAVYGDGSNTLIRFMIRDGKGQLESGPWITVNWKGWKYISWNLKTQPATGWAAGGNGILEENVNNPFYMDGVHVKSQSGSAQSGVLYFDNLRYIQHAAPVGIENITSEFKCELYPNPANDVVNIKSDAVIRNVSIFSTSGARIINNDPSSEIVTINVSTLSKGAYIVRIVTDSGIYTKKLIIR